MIRTGTHGHVLLLRINHIHRILNTISPIHPPLFQYPVITVKAVGLSQVQQSYDTLLLGDLCQHHLNLQHHPNLAFHIGPMRANCTKTTVSARMTQTTMTRVMEFKWTYGLTSMGTRSAGERILGLTCVQEGHHDNMGMVESEKPMTTSGGTGNILQ